jgi:hypothetical protein
MGFTYKENIRSPMDANSAKRGQFLRQGENDFNAALFRVWDKEIANMICYFS